MMCQMDGGVARVYELVFVRRVGTVTAEAGLCRAAVALAAAYFSRKHLPRALSIVLMGPFIGGGLSLIFGGLVIGALGKGGPLVWPIVGALQPWQMTLIMVSTVCILPILRSEEHTSELQSLLRISYAVFCLKK